MMNGEKNSLRTLLVIIAVIGILGSLFLDPAVGFVCLLLIAAAFVPTVFQVQSKNNCERLYSLLPIARKQLVAARFIFVASVYLILSVLTFAVMKISLALGIYKNSGFYEDLLAKMNSGIGYPRLCDMLFFLIFAAGASLICITLRERFRNSEKTTAADSIAVKPKTLLTALAFIALYIIIMLYFSGALPLNAAGSVILQLVIQLATAADGVLLCAVMTALALFSAVYNYVCTLLEYDDRDI